MLGIHMAISKAETLAQVLSC